MRGSQKKPGAAAPALKPQGTRRTSARHSLLLTVQRARMCTSRRRLSRSATAKGGVTQFQVFSAAGRMYGDLSKSAKDDTLEHSLLAASNTD